MNNNKLWNPVCALVFAGLSAAVSACAPAEPDHAHDASGDAGHPHAESLVTDEAKQPAAHQDHKNEPTIRSAESHVHGGASLSIVSEKNTVLIELETPLYNLLGFEYAPRTPEEQARVLEVETRLGQPQSLIQFNPDAKCTFVDSKTKTVLFPAGAGDHDDHDDHEDHDDHDDHEDHEGSAKHKDVLLTYALTCDAADKLKTVNVEFFQHFSNFTELELVYLGPTRQMSAELSRSRPRADLTR